MRRVPKVMIVLGTRPEIIRLSRVIAALDSACDLVVVHTGQNYDYELNEVFFEQLEIRRPDHFLEAGGGSVGETVGAIIARSEKVMMDIKPDAVLILGDTNSALSAYSARRLRIPVFHMEAGNRCFDRNVPEETNRKLVDHISDFNLAYTEHARRNLLAEGLAPRRIYVTGSPMREVLEYYRTSIEKSEIRDALSLDPQGYILASLHREENVDNPEKFAKLVRALSELSVDLAVPVVVSTHPRTRAKLDALEVDYIEEGIRWLKPFGFFDYNKLQTDALCVISDSGTIAEEASILEFAAITPRLSIERPEAMDTGAIIVCGDDPSAIVAAAHVAIDRLSGNRRRGQVGIVPVDYHIANTSDRVVNLVVGLSSLSNRWDGVEMPVASRNEIAVP